MKPHWPSRTRVRQLLCAAASACVWALPAAGVWAQQAPLTPLTPPPVQPLPAGGNEPAAAAVFVLDVQAPEPLALLLRTHLELVRYTHLSDLDEAELARLVAAADVQARQLLATQGHFAPHLDWHTQELRSAHPRQATAPSAAPDVAHATALAAPAPPVPPAATWRVTVRVQPGPQARIASVQWQFDGHMAADPSAHEQRSDLQSNWRLPVGQPFTQAQWQLAKTEALRRLTAEHYPLGSWRDTLAAVNPADHSVALTLHMDSGPQVRMGPVRILGQSRYDAGTTERLADIPTGQPYRLHDLLEAQQRLVLSGFFDSVFVNLDADGPPEAMPVRIELQESPLQRWQWGVGLRSDTGPRLTLEHTHHRVPTLGWRATTKLAWDRHLHSASTELLAPPDAQLWRLGLQAKTERQRFVGYLVDSQRLRAGRSQHTEPTDRSHYVQLDRAQTSGATPSTLSALSTHVAWTLRRFDSLPFPSKGWGLGLELGTGLTLAQGDKPYVRGLLKSLWMWPVGTHGHRMALRGQAGAVGTRHVDRIPSTQLFVAGGEHSVRGMAPGAIGVRQANGTVVAGRYMLAGSAEWIVPIHQAKQRTDWEALTFVDAGRVSNDTAMGHARVGVGVGVRWKSPVGPFEIDLARALATATDKGQWRLHMSIGFRL